MIMKMVNHDQMYAKDRVLFPGELIDGKNKQTNKHTKKTTQRQRSKGMGTDKTDCRAHANYKGNILTKFSMRCQAP